MYLLPYEHSRLICSLLFMLATLTDTLDGYLARRWNQESAFGAFLDPVADKLIVASALLLLVYAHPEAAMVIPALIIIGRELAISSLRQWMAEVGEKARVKVNNIGKIKTIVQMSSITLLLYQDDFLGLPVFTIGYIGLYIATLLTIWSMMIYMINAWPALMRNYDHTS